MSSARILALLLVLSGAAQFHTGVQWPTDMIRHPAPTALAEPPAGVLPTTGEPPLSRDEAGERLKNPLAASPEVLAEGRRLYDVYCLTCHGAAGNGDGPVGAKLGLAFPPLADPAIAERPDGYIYGTIRDGGFIMAAYGEVMSPRERWAVVHHVRSLQQR